MAGFRFRTLGEMIEGALRPVGKPMGPNARFGYPLRGGFQALMNGFLPHMKGELRLNTKVEVHLSFRPYRNFAGRDEAGLPDSGEHHAFAGFDSRDWRRSSR